jgi:hypothetical protein
VVVGSFDGGGCLGVGSLLASIACGGFQSDWQGMVFVLFWGINGTKYLDNCALIREKNDILQKSTCSFFYRFYKVKRPRNNMVLRGLFLIT